MCNSLGSSSQLVVFCLQLVEVEVYEAGTAASTENEVNAAGQPCYDGIAYATQACASCAGAKPPSPCAPTRQRATDLYVSLSQDQGRLSAPRVATATRWCPGVRTMQWPRARAKSTTTRCK